VYNRSIADNFIKIMQIKKIHEGLTIEEVTQRKAAGFKILLDNLT